MNKIWIACDWHLWNRKNNYSHPYRSISSIGKLSDNYTSGISPTDIFVHLGDIADPEKADKEKLKAIIQSIPAGYKVLCKGNHDTEPDDYYYDLGFDVVCEICTIYNVVLSHFPVKVNEDEVNVHAHLHSEKLSSLGYQHINAYKANFNDGPTSLDDLLDTAIFQDEAEYKSTDMAHYEKKFTEYTSAMFGNRFTQIVDISDRVPLAPIEESAKPQLDDSDADEILNEILFDDVEDTQYWMADDNTYRDTVRKAEDNQTTSMVTIKESADNAYQFNTPEELHRWMRQNIKYANFNTLMNQDDVSTSHKGSCHDQVAFAYPILKKMGLHPKILFFIEYRAGLDEGGMTHSLIYYEKNGKIYWFENAWNGMQGIHQYDSVEDLKKQIIRMHNNMPSSKKFPDLEFKQIPFSKFKKGSSLGDFVGSIMNEAADVSEYADIYMSRITELTDNANQDESMFKHISKLTHVPVEQLPKFSPKLTVKTDKQLCFEMLPSNIPWKIKVEYERFLLKIIKKLNKTKADLPYTGTIWTADGDCLLYVNLNDTPMNEMYLSSLSATGAHAKEILNDDTESLKEMTPEEKKKIANKYGLKGTGVYREKETDTNKTAEDRKKERDQKRLEDLKKARKIHKRNSRIRRIKKKIPFIKNESAGTEMILYHGSPKTFKTLKVYDSGISGAHAFATSKRSYALAYAGAQWSDFEINQSRIGDTIYLTEIIPGKFKEIFDRPGYIHTVASDGFKPFHGVEYISDDNIHVKKTERIPNVLKELESSPDVKLFYYPDLPPFIKDREEYLKSMSAKYGNHDISKILRMIKTAQNESMGDTVVDTDVNSLYDQPPTEQGGLFDGQIRYFHGLYDSEAYVENESATSSGDPTFDKIVNLNKKLNTFTYGLNKPGQTGKIKKQNTTSEDYDNFYHMASPEVFIKQEGGICWDFATYEASVFSKEFTDVSYETYYIVFDIQPDYPSHTFLVFRYNGKYCFFESSFKRIQGIWISDKLSDIFDFILHEMGIMHNERLMPYVKNNEYRIFKYNALNHRLYGQRAGRYMDIVESEGTIVKHRYSDKFSVTKYDSQKSIQESYQFELLDNVKFVEPLQESVEEYKDEPLYPVYIMLIHSGSALANAIKFMTQSNFSHSSISFDASMTNMYSFGRKADTNPFAGGFKKESIKSQFYTSRTIPYALYMVACTKSQVDQMKKRLNYFIKNSSKFKYDFTGLFKNYFGIADNPEYQWFCSRFVADILNAGRPGEHPYVVEPSLMRPEDFMHTTYAHYVTGGVLSNYDAKAVEKKVKTMLKLERMNRILESKKMAVNESAVLDLDPFNPYQPATLKYQLSQMDESATEQFLDYIRSFKIRFDKNGNIRVTRREYDQLDQHFRRSVRITKAAVKAGNTAMVKDELCKVYYMVSLIDNHYSKLPPVTTDPKQKQVRKDLLDLRSVMLNMFNQNLKYVTVAEPNFNFNSYYASSKYGKDVTIPKQIVTAVGKTIITLL